MGLLPHARAHWLTRDTIVWNVPPSPEHTYTLHYRPRGILARGEAGLALHWDQAGLSQTLLEKYPHLGGYAVLKLGNAAWAKVPDILKGEVAVSASDRQPHLVEITGLQIPGVLDDIYACPGPLGVVYQGKIPTLRVWAPTARSVKLRLFDSSTSPARAIYSMHWEAATGAWNLTGRPDWTGKYYLYEVEVYVPSTGRVEQNRVTDPYSLSLSTDSRRSQIVDLADPALKPPDWDGLQKPPLAAPEDSVIYELHVRDFSIGDQTVSPGHRGKFMAFTEADADGMRHLKALAEAGLTHLHLLPVFDFATVSDDEAEREEPDAAELATCLPDSEAQQAVVERIGGRSGFNWGYDPYHYFVPEGSYATQPEGSARIREFRAMVQALNQAGLRVVMDVVYNHTAFGGQHAKSVLDKVVPGYYYRLDAEGRVETSTCCHNTATEHAMMEKLMLDSLRRWATAYKVDGFRFDLMGHHMLSNLVNARAALDALTPERDGVAGKQIILYGEGWDFGEVANNLRGKNAAQLNIAGTGIGVFNDRLRDAARGGRPFSGLQEQGFLTGLFYEPNAVQPGGADEQRALLLHYSDLIRIGLAGSLRDYKLMDAAGNKVTGAEIDYYGQPAAHALDPQECVNYVSVHDNETLFDAIQLKTPETMSLADRVRMHRLGLSLVLLGQGLPFFHAGDDMLRSKSLDRNSYRSGDWFNKLDFTYETNNWGVGLPPAGDNAGNWPVMKLLLADPALRPAGSDILGVAAHFREMLRIRRSSPLFRLRTAEEVKAALQFFNVGPGQIPGVIGMRLSSAENQLVVVFNATPSAQVLAEPSLVGKKLELHPVLAASHDPIVRQSTFDTAAGTMTVPARTTTVFAG